MKTSRISRISRELGPLALLPLLLSGCDEALEPGTKIDSFRVLAEQADLPYAHPGETVQLTSLSFDPAARQISWAWATCVNPQSSDLAGCLAEIYASDDPTRAIFAMGPDTPSPSLTIPADAISSLPASARAAATVGVLSAACPGDLSIDQGPGDLPFRCQEPGTGRDLKLDEFIVGFKRISVRETERNQNPVITGITFDGVDWPEDEIKTVGFCDADDFVYGACPSKDKHQLAAQLSPESFEHGTDELGHDFTEQLVIQHYATEGIFEFEVRTGQSPKTGFVARKRASGQTLSMWFVARDDRGGVSWAKRQVTVR